MQWQNCDDVFEEEITLSPPFSDSTNDNSSAASEKDEKTALQLIKYQDPTQDKERSEYVGILTKFNELSIQGKHQDIINSLFTSDSEIFVFNMAGKDTAQNYQTNDQLKSLYEGVRILERHVHETYVDLEKKTAIQFSMCHIFYEDNETIGDEAVCEIFSFNGGKIGKYRLSFGVLTEAHGPEDPLEATRKDRMLAKVKEINYALADQPDLEKVASLLHESTEYKIWSWDDLKLFVFTKSSLVLEFRNLEENFIIKSIVPYEVYNEQEYVIGTYVYYLESKHTIPKRKFAWVSSCVYSFDRHLNIAKIGQQGELYPEEDANIPFEVYSRERIQQKVKEVYASIKPGLEFLSNGEVQFDCDISRFGPFNSPNFGCFRGLNKISQISKILPIGDVDFDWIRVVDAYVDYHDPSYDVAIFLNCSEGAINRENCHLRGIKMNFFCISKFAFENGKLAKICQFLTAISKPIPSPYDDPYFEALNIKRKEF